MNRTKLKAVLLFALTSFVVLSGCASVDGHYFITPNLSEDRARAIVAGMTVAEVDQRLGAPHQKVRFENLRATAWDYRYTDTWGYITDFAVMIGDDGRVVNVVATRVVPVDR